MPDRVNFTIKKAKTIDKNLHFMTGQNVRLFTADSWGGVLNETNSVDIIKAGAIQ